VVLDIEEYERMLEEFEDILARQVYDRAKAELEHGDDELIPWESRGYGKNPGRQDAASFPIGKGGACGWATTR
jgi:hypothetical protein